MEPFFGHNFGRVRVHTDADAAESARAVNALAYSVGAHVVFATSRYAPATAPGRSLLAHELTHVVQQKHGASGATPLAVAPSDSAYEREAENVAAEALAAGTETANADVTRSRRSSDVGAGTVAGLLLRQEEPRDERSLAGESNTNDRPGCAVGSGIPDSRCSAYAANSWWLPLAYVNNATCACQTTPNTPTASCVRKFLQDRLAATPAWLKVLATSQKPQEVSPVTYPSYQAFVQTSLTPRIYRDHVDAYSSCCCPSGPAPYLSWVGVTTVPIRPCSVVGAAIAQYGSCHGTPGRW
jgi:hypothetical protein